MVKFEIVDKHDNRTLFEFGPGSYSLGKGDKCDVILNDSHVSRAHARLDVSAHTVTLTDQGSTNGTWARGARIEGAITLAVRDVVNFGELKLVVLQVPDNSRGSLEGVDRRPAKSQKRQESEALVAMKRKVHSLILDYLDLRKRANLQEMDAQELREEAEKATSDIIRDHVDFIPDGLSRAELQRQVVAEAVGLGALEPLLADDSVTEVMVNGPDQIYVEKDGRLTLSESRFTSTQSLLAIIDRIVAPLGRRIDESSPMVDARLLDGSRVNAIIPPLLIPAA